MIRVRLIDIVAVDSELGRAGGEIEIRYGAGGFGPSIYIEDPDGNTVELRCEL